MTLRARSCAAALVTVGLALYTESAHADSAGAPAPPTCSVALAPGQAGVTLPANAPGLLVVDQSGGHAPTLQATLVNGATRTELTAATDTHGLWTLALPTPAAAPGTYSVEVTSSCASLEDKQLTVSLTLTVPVSLPTSVGTLVHVPSNPPTGVDKVRFDPTPSMRAFLPAAQLDLLVDGKKAGKSIFPNATSPIELNVNTGDVCIENGALHREKRVVKITFEGAIAGVAESPAPASIDVPVDCGAIAWTSGLDLDGDGNGTGTGTGNTRTPAGSNGTTYSSAPSSDSGGCSASPIATHGGALGYAAFAIGGLGLVAMRRRRRR